MVRLAKVNLFLHDFKEPKITEYDTLTDKTNWKGKYDVILANPPFMTPKGGIKPHELFMIPANRSEVLFVDYIMEHLTKKGRAGVIVPEGIVFPSQNAYKNLRKALVEESLYAVVSLPSGVFNPYSGVKTSILFMDKALAKATDDILFVKIGSDGFDLGAQRRAVSTNDLPQALDILEKYRECVLADTELPAEITDNELVTIAGKEKIAAQDYILVGDRYREAVVHNSKFPMVALGEVCEIYNGSTPSRENEDYWDDGNIPWFTIDDIRSQGRQIFCTSQFVTEKALKETSVKLLPSNTVLLCCTASVGEYAISKIRLTTNQQFNGLVVKNECNDLLLPEYLFNLSYGFNAELQRLGGQTSFKFVSVKNVKQIQIPLPPLHIQAQIVAEIEGYQKIIDGAKQVVDNYKPAIKIDPAWEMVELGNVCGVQAGGTPLKNVPEYWENGNIPWYTSGELNDIYTTSSKNFITELGFQNSSAKLINKGSLLIGMYDTAAFKMSILDRQATCNQAVCAITPSLKINMLFLLLYFLQNREIYMKQRVGARQRNLTKDYISKLMIPIPSLDVQQKIVARIENEQKAVAECNRLIEIFEGKIKDKISEVWGD